MPVYFTVLAVTSTITPGDALASMALDVRVTTGARDSELILDPIDITDDLFTAYTAPNVKIGFRVEVDLGTGDLVAIPMDDMAAALTITESRSGWSDVASFAITGRARDPLSSAILRGKFPCVIYGIYGEDGNEVEDEVFTGYLDKGDWTAVPPVATYSVLDNASLVAQRLVDINVPENSRRSVASIVGELLDSAGWTGARAIQLPDVRRVKPISDTGRSPFELINEIVSPFGAEAAVIDGTCYVKRFVAAAVPDLILTPGMIDPTTIRISAPTTSAPNLVTATGSTFGEELADTAEEPDGLGVPQISESWEVDYIPPVAFEELETNGTATPITPTFIPSIVGTRGVLVTRVITTEEAISPPDVAVPSRTTTEEIWGYYAPEAAPISYEYPPGGPEELVYMPVFRYPDGKWRSQSTPSWRLILRTTTVEMPLTGTRTGIERVKTTEGWRNPRRRIGELDASLDFIRDEATSPSTPLFETEEGEGLTQSVETFGVLEIETQTIITTAEGYTMTDTTVLEEFYARARGKVQGAGVFGPIAAVTFKLDSAEFIQQTRTRVLTYITTAGDTSYKVFDVLSDPRIKTQTKIDGPFPGSRPQVVYSDPLAEDFAQLPASQVITATFRNETSIELNGEIPLQISNNAAETAAELAFAAREAARLAAQVAVFWAMPFDITVHKFKTVTLDCVVVDLDGVVWDLRGKRLMVTDVTRNLNASDASNSQDVGAVWDTIT